MNWQFKGVGGPSKQPYSATFKAILIAVDTSKTLQTKCKTCFGGTRMIQMVSEEKNTFWRKQLDLFSADQTPLPLYVLKTQNVPNLFLNTSFSTKLKFVPNLQAT